MLAYVPRTTIAHTTTAVSGTTMYFDHPNSSRLLAIPANSATTFDQLSTTSVSIRKNVMRNPNSSRMRSLRPLPVTAPMRDAISCTTISATVIGIMVHSSEYPNWAPACEYVKMPPASLSTFAVMNPGPTTARNNATRVRHSLRSSFIASAVAQHRDHVVGRDDAGQPAVLVDDGQRDQVVFVEQFGDLRLRRVGRARDVRLAQVRELRRRRRGGNLHERHDPDELRAVTG